MNDVEITNDILMKLAFQRGMLTLLKENELLKPTIEKALADLDSVIEKLC